VTHGDFRTRLAKRIFLKTLEEVRSGCLELACSDGVYTFGNPAVPPQATVFVHDDRFFARALFGADVGIGESYMDGDWTSPNVADVVRFGIRNLSLMENRNRVFSALNRGLNLLRHRLRPNTPAGSEKNIHAHYDLGNEFFRLFLDRNLAYSCAYYESAEDSLEQAQLQKFDRICRKLELQPEDHLLEIGTGWGGFAAYAASHFGCRVTTTTISRKQYEYAGALFVRQGLDESRIRLLPQDYRDLSGEFDKIASIEMFEAVGYDYYDEFFGACNRLLKPGGTMLLQTITMNEKRFPQYRHETDWIQKHVFPGSELASLLGILASLARATDLSLSHAEDIGLHYVYTLRAWREQFNGALESVRQLGFDDRFVRMWDFYLAYCEAAFRERYIGDFQLVLRKNVNHPIIGKV
jgi:cyclopropane-fatty-acyl-phospholipid synthase